MPVTLTRSFGAPMFFDAVLAELSISCDAASRAPAIAWIPHQRVRRHLLVASESFLDFVQRVYPPQKCPPSSYLRCPCCTISNAGDTWVRIGPYRRNSRVSRSSTTRVECTGSSKRLGPARSARAAQDSRSACRWMTWLDAIVPSSISARPASVHLKLCTPCCVLCSTALAGGGCERGELVAPAVPLRISQRRRAQLALPIVQSFADTTPYLAGVYE
jgi:hypothetical protein